MITDNEITEIGRFNQPHGIKGEISATIAANFDIEALSCIVVDIDGINVPFFITNVRSKGSETFLLTIDGIDDERQASMFNNRIIYAKSDEVADESDDSNNDGFYADDLIGFQITTADNSFSGEITDIDDSTENILFVVSAPDGHTSLIPVADEFITHIDARRKLIVMELPDGLLSL